MGLIFEVAAVPALSSLMITVFSLTKSFDNFLLYTGVKPGLSQKWRNIN